MSHGGRMQELAEDLERTLYPNGRPPQVTEGLREKRRAAREAAWRAMQPKPVPAAQYMAQMAEAARHERQTHQELLAAGWVWDEECRMYTHPDHAGTTISY